MFWYSLLVALAGTFTLVAPVAALATIGCKNYRRLLITAGTTFIVMTFMNWFGTYFFMPTLGYNWMSIEQTFWGLVAELFIVVVAIGWATVPSEEDMPSVGAIAAIVALILFVLFGVFARFVWTQGRADVLKRQASVEIAPINSYPDTDANHMLMVPEETADFKASQVLAGTEQRNLGTIFNVSGGTLQSVAGHLYWIYELKPSSWKVSGKEIPGFVVVDAEDPNVPAQLKLGYHIRYSPGKSFGNKLERYLYRNGYASQVVTDLTLEVDDNWQPFYTASLDELALSWRHTVPKATLVIDPQTGKIQRFGLDNIPEWVDRVYSQSVVEEMLNWWGNWGNAPYKLIGGNNANRYKVSDDPVLVYTKGGHPVWQAIITSKNRDTAAAYLALFDGRDNKVRLYPVNGLTLESVAESTILGSRANLKKLQPVHMTLHRIYGTLTWVAPMINPEGGSSAFQGVTLLKADDVNGGSLVISDRKSDALTAYRQILAQGNDNGSPEENANFKTVDGLISQVSSVVEGGQTVFYFTLSDDTTHVYRAGVGGQMAKSLELPFAKAGARVRLMFLDTGSAQRDVGAYDDLAMNVTN